MSDLFPVAANESLRLDALRALEIVGTPPEDHFDAVCRTAAALFSLPIALVSLIEEKNQWFKAKCGVSIEGTSRDLAFCNHAILSSAVFVVEDASRDPRFARNALVTGDPGIRFYAGAPLEVEPGLRIGTLCVIDIVPRSFSSEQCRQLEDLAAIVVAHLSLNAADARSRREIAARQAHESVIAEQAATLREREARLSDANRLLLMAEQMAHIGHCRLELGTGRRTWSAGLFRIFGIDPSRGEPSCDELIERLHPDDRDHGRQKWDEVLAKTCDFSFETRIIRSSGEIRTVVWRGTYEPDDGAGAYVIVTMDVTDLHRTEVRLMESEGRFRLLVEGITDCAICMLDPYGVVTNWHAGCERIYGYRSEEFLGRHVSRLYGDEDRMAGLPRATLDAAKRDGLATSEGWRRRKDGRSFWACDVVQPIRDGQGTLIGFAQLTRDVTHQQQAAEALRTSEARYRILADSLPQMVWIMDRDSRDTIYANRRFDTYYGAVDASFRDRIARYHPDDRAMVERAWDDGAIARGDWEADVRLMRQDETWRWHKLMIVPINRGDAVANWLGTALDIHDAVTAQDALLQSADLLRIAQTAAGAGTWDVDLVSDAIVLSPESAAMHGLDGSRGAMLTMADWNEIVHPEDSPKVWAEVKRSVEAQETYSAEFRVLLPDGGIRWVHGIGRAYYDAQGGPVRMVGLNFDVDRRKEVEAALIEASRGAETARREAEKASAAKTDFLAAMSHEIRTPLNSILGYTDMLLEAAPDEPSDRTKLRRILGSGRALLTIVNDVLDFSKIEAGRIELEPEVFSFPGLIADTMAMIRGLATDKPLSLRTDICADLPQVLVGDQNRLRQILLNLLNNAVKFTHSGEVVLTMSGERRLPGRLRLRCEISDTGIGIPHDKRDRLFQRFSQVDGSISRRFGGTGLGLAISKSLVELMGGEIGIESRSGPGSTFWFTVELVVGEVAPALPEAAAPPVRACRPARILLVEDVVTNQEIAKAVLSSGGHHVDLACDGTEAVQAVGQVTYDIILMDVQMPVMDGLEATARIRALGGRHAEIPILALTANVLPEQVASFRRAGMVDHVGKPFRKSDLLSAVARWVPAGTPDVPSGVLDRATFEELKDLLGGEKLARMLGSLEAVLVSDFVLDPTVLAAGDESGRDLAGTAHKLVSSAGMLGFMALSDTCRAFEQASRAGCLTGAEIDRAVEASQLALTAMDALRRDLAGPSPAAAAHLRTAS